MIAILSEKNETDFESVHVKDIDGNHIGDNAENSNRLRCSYGKELEERIHELQRENRDFVVIHNHPNNTPPSPKDFYDAFQKGYKFGIIAGHDGSIYKYYPPKHGLSGKDIDKIIFNINTLLAIDLDKEQAFLFVLNRFNCCFKRII